jgi:hypothetical protein
MRCGLYETLENAECRIVRKEGFIEQIPHVAAGNCPIMSVVQLSLQNPVQGMASFL